MLHPGEVGVAGGRIAELPALVPAQPVTAPVGDVKGGISEDEVGPEIGVAVIVEGVTVGDLAVDASDCKVHLGEPPGSVVRLLPIDRDVGPRSFGDFAAITVAAGMSTDEFHRLHKHARGAAADVRRGAVQLGAPSGYPF